MLTPEQRSAVERRIDEVTDQMKALDHLRRPENIVEWAKLYEVREELQKTLDDASP